MGAHIRQYGWLDLNREAAHMCRYGRVMVVRWGADVLAVERDFEWRSFAKFVLGSFWEPVPLEYET